MPEKKKRKGKEKEITSIFPRFPSPRGVDVVVVEKGPSKTKRIVGKKKYLERKKKLIPDYGGFPRIFSFVFFFIPRVFYKNKYTIRRRYILLYTRVIQYYATRRFAATIYFYFEMSDLYSIYLRIYEHFAM